MPQRFLRPTLRQSKRWNRCPYDAQSLFVRLLMLVDDFARYEADPELLRSEAFPFGDPDGNPITVANICLQLQTLASKDMLILYEVDGVKYLQLTRWKENARSEKSRFPAPCKQMLSDVSKCSLPSSSPSSPPSPSPSPTPSPSPVPVERVFELAKSTAETLRAAPANDQPLLSLQRIVNALYSRPDGHRWSCAEECALAEIARRDGCIAEAELLVRFRKRLLPEEKRFFPQSASKLLEKWDETLDRARLRVTPPAQKPKAFKPPAGAKKFEHSPELAQKFRDAAKKATGS